MKILISLAHPDIDNSIIHKRFLKEAVAQSFAVRDLACEYPSGEIDGERERAIIKAHDALVLQFPLHNFSSPAILKSWIDATMTYGFAYGRTSEGIRGRAVALAVSAGIKRADYAPSGRYHFTMEQILAPFELAFRYYFHADWRGFFAFYGAEETPGVDYESSAEQIEKGAAEYAEFLRNLGAKSGAGKEF